jgi:hypothetical protein
MNKSYIISGGIGVILIIVSLLYYIQRKDLLATPLCETDVMVCADGSTVPRVAPSCEFSVCKDSVASLVATSLPVIAADEKSFGEELATTTRETPSVRKKLSQITVAIPTANPIISFINNTVSKGASFFTQSPTQETSSVSNNNSVNNQSPAPTYNDTRFNVIHGSLTDTEGNVVASIPGPTYTPPQGTSNEWQTHTVNAVLVGSTTPIIDGVPVEGQAGKYYISENSFGNKELCEFSNRIYIFDSSTNDKTLLYEENSSTLNKDDPRACNSEIYLLATESEKLIFKYHTLFTNMVCESTWSAPHETWYISVNNVNLSTHYSISTTRYEEAETKELACRSQLESEGGAN